MTRLELFLDLVFVYAFINVTGLTAANFNPIGLLRGLLLLALLWWCWVSYAWLGNNVRMDRGVTPVVMFGLIATLFVVGVTLKEAFVDRPGGLSGPVVFAVGYLIARSGASLIVNIGWPEREQRRKFVWAWPPLIGCVLLLLAAAVLPARLVAPADAGWVQLLLVLLAVLVEYSGILLIGVEDWRIHSVSYWAERHNLIILIALGETIMSVGVTGSTLTWPTIGSILLGIAVVGVLWWSYFDLASVLGERALAQTSGGARTRLARAAYTFCHVLMIGGLILVALGLKHVLLEAETGGYGPAKWDGLIVLYGGVLLYLLGLIAFERLTLRIIGRSPVVGVALTIGLLPVTGQVPVLGALALLCAAMSAMVLVDRTVFRSRHQLLHASARSYVLPVTGVTPTELFFDLVFVYAFIQVTGLMVADPTWRGLLRAVAVLTLLWWAWSGYAWLTSAIHSEAAVVRIVLLLVVASVLVITVTLPEAFRDAPGGLSGPVLFLICYGLVRVLQLAAYRIVARGDPAPRRHVAWAGVLIVVTLGLLLGAALAAPPAGGVHGVTATQALLWLAAILVDFGGGSLVVLRHWRLSTAEHWAHRHGLIIIVALGQAVISMGLSLAAEPISVSTLAAVVLGTFLLGTLWWTYFDVDALACEHALRNAGRGRKRLARNAYTYLHLPLVIGVVLVSFGLRQSLSAIHEARITGSGADVERGYLALYGGVVLYLLADQVFWRQARRPVRPLRIVVITILVALIPVTAGLPSLTALAILTAVCVLFVAIDALHTGEIRRALRGTG